MFLGNSNDLVSAPSEPKLCRRIQKTKLRSVGAQPFITNKFQSFYDFF